MAVVEPNISSNSRVYALARAWSLNNDGIVFITVYLAVREVGRACPNDGFFRICAGIGIKNNEIYYA
ncbi:MAG: hypothetical protein MZV63_26750 [Marinilabiliales bacterium]|nr:hypothetical protein [Marinilabiliales bacterium]